MKSQSLSMLVKFQKSAVKFLKMLYDIEMKRIKFGVISTVTETQTARAAAPCLTTIRTSNVHTSITKDLVLKSNYAACQIR